MAMWRIEAVKGETGHRSHASIYTQIRVGLFTKPVPIGARSVGWPDYEVKAITQYRVAGKTDDEIRALVNQLHAQRQQMVAAASQASVAMQAGIAA